MKRCTLTIAMLFCGALPAIAQSHPQTHSSPRQHGPGHVRRDSVTHAAIHAMLHGTWTGTFAAQHGPPSVLDMSYGHDSLHLILYADRVSLGSSKDFLIKDQELQWTQEVAGATCRTTAVLTAATPKSPETMKGKMACADGERTFILRRKTS